MPNASYHQVGLDAIARRTARSASAEAMSIV